MWGSRWCEELGPEDFFEFAGEGERRKEKGIGKVLIFLRIEVGFNAGKRYTPLRKLVLIR